MKNKLLKKLIAVANEAIHPKVGMVCASNELTDLGDGWFEVPYGEYPHKEGLQILERADAEGMVATFNEMRSDDPIWKATVYIGHPDHPVKKIRDDYPDKAAYGWIDQVAANEAGFRFHVEWTPNGQELVDNKSYRYFSPLFWTTKPVANVGRKVIRPRIFQSIGLTNTPNMGSGCWVGNEDHPEQGDNMKSLLERLKALINNDSIQTDDDVVNIFQKMVDALKKLREIQENKWKIENVAYDVAENEDVLNNAINLIGEIDGLVAAANDAIPEATATQITELEGTVGTLTTDLETANGLVVAANEGAVKAFTALAITQGKLKPADEEGKIAELLKAEDLVAAGNEMLAGESVIKTTTKTDDLKVIDMSATQKRDGQIAAANTIMEETAGLTFQQAWKRAETDERFAALFTKEDAAE